VFTSQPLDVEVYRNGVWWPGSLLGWRHDADGGCRVRVRLAGDGAEESWTALEFLRLPEVAPAPPAVRHLSVVDTPARASDAALTATMAAVRSVPSPVARAAGAPAPSELTATMNLFAVRDLDDDTQAAATPAPGSGGRRRAPETEHAVASVPMLAVAPGRHRAPAVGGGGSGRHRAADTGMWPAVRQDDAPAPPSPASRDDGPDRHLLTRPMRLDDVPGRVPQPRRAALEGRLAGL